MTKPWVSQKPWQAVFALLLLALQVACSDDTPSGTTATATLDPKSLTLVTDTAPGEVAAGATLNIHCRAFKPSGQAGVLGDEVALPSPATVVVEGPANPLSIQQLSVRLALVGEYSATCRIPSIPELQAQPGKIYVVAGQPATIDTALTGIYGQPSMDPKALSTTQKAGTLLQFQCLALDSWGNPVTQGLTLQPTPAQLAPPSGLVLAATVAGPLQVACAAGNLVDNTPVLLTIEPNVPRHLYTLLQPDKIVAGNAAGLTCVANDAYGNAIADFPFSLDHPEAVKIKGLYATATLVGAYKIQCVPETLAWDLFTLHPAMLQVQPGPPAALAVQAVPQKTVYKQEEKVQFLSEVRDAFGNLVPTATVALSVTTPPKGYKVVDDKTVKFAVDGTYNVHFIVNQAPQLHDDKTIIVDGTPPQLTIDYPPWGSTLDGKPSVAVKGTAGDATSGIQTLTLNGKNVFVSNKSCQTDADCGDGTCNVEKAVCSVGSWVSQYGAKHGLNPLLAVGKDIGGQERKATRGFYFSGKYYPVDAAQPQAALVPGGIQVFLGKDFLDDGNHDPQKPDDLATLIEIALAGLDFNSLLPPGGLSSGPIEVKLSNLKLDKPKITLQPVDGGIDMQVIITNFSTDLDVKATQKIGPISLTIKVGGDLKIGKLTLVAGLGMSVKDGVATAQMTKSSAQIDGMKLHVDGIGGLLDFLWNILLDAYKGQLTDALLQQLNSQVPGLISGLLNQFALNQAIALPALLPGQPAMTLQLVSKLQTLQFSPAGGVLALQAGFVAPKGTPHNVLGAIARSGCIGTVEDKFVLDQNQRLQLAIHDDVINQALHAVWLGGALKLGQIDLAGLAGSGASASPFPLDGATLDLDLFLPPILETCDVTDPMKVKLQVGDAYAQANLPLGEPSLALGFFASLNVGATLSLNQTPEGKQQLAVIVDKQIDYQLELASITKGYEDSASSFEGLVGKLLQDQLSKGLPGLDKLTLDLPSLDTAGLIPGLPAGSKITLKLKDLHRQSGFTAIDATLQ